MAEEGMTEGRHFAAGEKKSSERVIGKQEFDHFRIEAKQKVESGEDREGNFLYSSLKESFTASPDSSRFGAAANTFTDARKSAEKIDDPAELEKAIISLGTFNEHLGLGKYEVTIETDEKTTPEQRRALIKEKVKQDIEKMPELFAHHELSDYYDHKAKTSYLQNELKTSLPMGKVYEKGIDTAKIPPRQYARLDAYEMQREADKVYWAGQRIVDDIGEDRVSREFHNLRRQRLSYTEESAVPLSARTEEERDNLVNERVSSLRRQLEESKGKKAAETFDHLSDSQKKSLASDLYDDEQEVLIAGKNFDKAVQVEDADKITAIVSQSKEARVKVKERLAEVDVALAAQRSKDATTRLTQIRRKIALGGGRQHWLKKEEVDEGLSVVKEKVSAFVGENVSELKRDVSPVVDQVIQKAESADDALLRGVVWVGEKFDATVGRAADAVKDNLREARNNVGDAINRISPGMERRRLNMRRNLYDKRHALSVAKDRVMSELGIAGLEVKHQVSLQTRKVIGGSALTDEERAKLDNESKKISEGAAYLYRTKSKEHDERRKNNPHFEHFWKEVDKYVTEVVNKPPETVVAQTTPTAETQQTQTSRTSPQEAHTNKALEKELRSKIRPDLTDYEILKYKDNSGEYNVLVWTDGKIVRSEEVNETGTFIKAFSDYELKEGEDPKEVINRSLSELTSKYDQSKENPIIYKRGLYFSVDKDGKWVIMEEGKDGEATLEPPDKKAVSDKEKKKGEPMTQEELQKMYPNLKEHEIVIFKDKDGKTQRMLGWWDGEKFRAVMISSLGKRYGQEQGLVETNSPEAAVKLFNEQIKKIVPEGTKLNRGFKLTIDQEGKVQITKPERKGGKKVKEDEERPEDVTEAQLYDRVKERRQSSSNAITAHRTANSRESMDNAFVAVRAWEESLTEYNRFLNTKLPSDRTDLDDNPDYVEYKSVDQELTDITRHLREVQRKPGSEVWDEEKVLEGYENKMRVKYRLYDRMRTRGIFK